MAHKLASFTNNTSQHEKPRTPTKQKRTLGTTEPSKITKFNSSVETDDHMKRKPSKVTRRPRPKRRTKHKTVPDTLGGKGFGELVDHAKLDHKQKCFVCKKMYLLQADLNRHFASKHSEELFKWLSSKVAVDHMVSVMSAKTDSVRHTLFLNRKERQACSGAGVSRLYELSSPGFLNCGEFLDIKVIKQLTDEVFHPNLGKAEPELQEVIRRTQLHYDYVTVVLFPETFIHQLQVLGKTRGEAEEAFLKVDLDPNEAVSLRKEFREAAQRRMEAREDSDIWVDNSDMEDSDSESMTEVNKAKSKDANDILVLSPPNSLGAAGGSKADQVATKQPVVKFCQFPPDSVDSVSVTNEDYANLEAKQWINDAIIDFYLKYIQHQESTSVEGMMARTHIFTTYFYKRLTTQPCKAKEQPAEDSPELSEAGKRYERVKKWTKKVNIFEKDFIIVPINKNEHWFVCIICFPGYRGAVREDGGSGQEESGVQYNMEEKDRVEAEAIKDKADKADDEPPSARRPCILIFDSLNKRSCSRSKARTCQILRDYLSCEWRAKMEPSGEEKRLFDTASMPCSQPTVQQQPNLSDCGIYLLQYIESFFRNPIQDYNFPIKTLEKDWFTIDEVEGKRRFIAELIRKLAAQQNPDKEFSFPGLNLLNPKEEADESKGASPVTQAQLMATGGRRVGTQCEL